MGGSTVELAPAARSRIEQGRAHLERLLAAGERIYGVNTGVGGNIVFQLSPDQAVLLQTNIMRHLSCATGQPLPTAVVRTAMLLRLATFATGCSGVRLELVDALAALLNAGVIPIVPRYGSVGASGDLMPSAYVARALIGMGEVEYRGRRMPAEEGLVAAGLKPISFAPKEGLALINGTTMMTAAAALLWTDTQNVLRALLAALALSLEAMQAPSPMSIGCTPPKDIPARLQWPPTFAIFCTAAVTSPSPAARLATRCAALRKAWAQSGSRSTLPAPPSSAKSTQLTITR
jgi:histidine ammonia-lyase